jgi:peptidoglycan hydrolase-like protein with peptidoglycan-binding domain
MNNAGFGAMRISLVGTFALVTLSLATSLFYYDPALAVRTRNYTPGEFRTLLRSLGYQVELGETLKDIDGKRAIREFQEQNNLAVDGIVNSQTQDLAADLIVNLQNSLNIVVQPDPPLPNNEFYGPRTEAAIREFQRRFLLPETGIATLEVRQKLNQEARKISGFK